jgi:hypothetical protein
MKLTKTQLKRIIKEELESVMEQEDPNIQKIENIVYSLPEVTRENFTLDIQPPDPQLPGEYKVFHSEYAMGKLASLAKMSIQEITSKFEDAGFVVSERWSADHPVVLRKVN